MPRFTESCGINRQPCRWLADLLPMLKWFGMCVLDFKRAVIQVSRLLMIRIPPVAHLEYEAY
jgi:hypothetical protein